MRPAPRRGQARLVAKPLVVGGRVAVGGGRAPPRRRRLASRHVLLAGGEAHPVALRRQHPSRSPHARGLAETGMRWQRLRIAQKKLQKITAMESKDPETLNR